MAILLRIRIKIGLVLENMHFFDLQLSIYEVPPAFTLFLTYKLSISFLLNLLKFLFLFT